MKKWSFGHTRFYMIALYGIAIFLCVGCLILIWPVGIIRTPVESHNGADGRISVGPLSDEMITEQFFVPQFSYLESISIAIVYEEIQDPDSAVAVLTILDSEGEEIFSVKKAAVDFTSSGFCEIPVGIFLKKGQQYRWTVSIESDAQENIGLLATDPDVITPVENSLLYYDGEVTSSAAVVDYVYAIIPGKTTLLIYDSFILTIFLLAVLGIRHLQDRKPSAAANG